MPSDFNEKEEGEEENLTCYLQINPKLSESIQTPDHFESRTLRQRTPVSVRSEEDKEKTQMIINSQPDKIKILNDYIKTLESESE